MFSALCSIAARVPVPQNSWPAIAALVAAKIVEQMLDED